jgi:hypothetical protein
MRLRTIAATRRVLPMSNVLEIAVNKQVPTVGHVLKALASMERELTAAKTYDGIKKIIKQATALKVLLGHVDEVKQRAEDTILVASMRIGEEIKKVAKASGGDRRPNLPARGDLKNGREQLDVPRTPRSRLTKLADAGKAAVKKAAEQLRHKGKDATPRAVAILLTQGDKKERRDERERKLGAKQRALPQKHYGCLLIGPPYRFEVHSRETGLDRSADNHYPTMTIQELMLLPVSSVAAVDSVMFLWATAPHLANAIALMAHWGFAVTFHANAGTQKVQRITRTRGTRHALGARTPFNETRCDADEHVAELELQSRLRFVGTLPNTRSHWEIPRPAPG